MTTPVIDTGDTDTATTAAIDDVLSGSALVECS
jgi:hypothetical protein